MAEAHPAITAACPFAPVVLSDSGNAGANEVRREKTERRRETETGKIYTFEEFQKAFAGDYSAEDIAAYWRDACEPMPSEPDQEGKGDEGAGQEQLHSSSAPSSGSPDHMHSREALLAARASAQQSTTSGFKIISMTRSSGYPNGKVQHADAEQVSEKKDEAIGTSKEKHEAVAARDTSGGAAIPRHLPQAGEPSAAPMEATLWIGPLPLPHNKEQDQQELLTLLEGLRILKIDMHRQYAYVTVPRRQAWEVKRRVLGCMIRSGPKLSAREWVESARFVPCRTSPFDVCFSQKEIADRFRNEALLDDVVPKVSLDRGADGLAVLSPPFGPIRVLGDGAKLVALDNRRLYVLQKKATQLWPRPCVIEVLLCEGQPPSEFWAKLATRGTGDSVIVLSALYSEIATRWSERTKWARRWCWEDALLEAEDRMARRREAQQWSERQQYEKGRNFWKPGSERQQYERGPQHDRVPQYEKGPQHDRGRSAGRSSEGHRSRSSPPGGWQPSGATWTPKPVANRGEGSDDEFQ